MKTMRKIPFVLAAFALPLAMGLTACSNAKEQLGLTRSAPDEFAVVKRAPLEMPPDYHTLRPPRPGAPRPQEISPSVQAESALFGARQTPEGVSKSEAALLEAAGTYNAVVGIRDIVDQETAATPPRQQPVAKRLLNIGSDKPQTPEAEIVDPAAEAERLRQESDAPTPSVTR